MSTTSISPRYGSLSARYMASFFCCNVSVRSARMMFWRMLSVLSSVKSPDGMSMLTTKAGDALIYLTNDAKPPCSGLLSPEPNSPSITIVCSSSCGGSKFCLTSVKFFTFFVLRKSFMFCEHSSDSFPVVLNRKTSTL